MMMRTEEDGGDNGGGDDAEEKGKVTSCPAGTAPALPVSVAPPWLARFLGGIPCSLFPLPLLLPFLPSFFPSLFPLSAVSVGLGSFGPKKLKKQEATEQVIDIELQSQDEKAEGQKEEDKDDNEDDDQ